MVTTDWVKFHERKDNGLVSDVFNSESRMSKLPGGSRSFVSVRAPDGCAAWLRLLPLHHTASQNTTAPAIRVSGPAQRML